MKFGLKETDIKLVNSVFASYPQVKKVVIYGSRAKGNFKNGSDIDITLIGDGLNLYVLAKISFDIDELLLPYSFDISIFEKIKDKDILDHIERVGMTFYDRG